MTPDTEPSTAQEPMTDEQLAACVTWHVKNIREYADTTYWMLRNLNEELIRTRKALEIATKCINWVIDTFQKGLEHESDVVGCCELSLERIEKSGQKDVKCK